MRPTPETGARQDNPDRFARKIAGFGRARTNCSSRTLAGRDHGSRRVRFTFVRAIPRRADRRRQAFSANVGTERACGDDVDYKIRRCVSRASGDPVTLFCNITVSCKTRRETRSRFRDCDMDRIQSNLCVPPQVSVEISTGIASPWGLPRNLQRNDMTMSASKVASRSGSVTGEHAAV